MMSRFFEDKVDQSWFLGMFEKYSGQRIASTRTRGYRSQILDLILEDPEANEKFSTRCTGPYGGFYQLALELDTGELYNCELPDNREKTLGVKGLYEQSHTGVKVMEVRPVAWSRGWTLMCRSDDDAIPKKEGE